MAGDWLPPQAPGGRPPEAPPPAPEYPPAGPAAPGYPPRQAQPPPTYGYPPQPPNNDAVAGFTCGIVGAALLFFSAGLSTVISLVLGIVAIPYSQKGKRNVAEGRTQKHRDLARAGYVIGIVTVVLSLIATAVWVLIFSLVDWTSFDDPNNDPFDEDFEFQTAVRIAAAAVRLIG